MRASDIPGEVQNRFREARAVTVLTGAGVSAESGVDTFRGEDGTWSKVDVESVATPEGFARDPKYVWQWYDDRRIQMAAVDPNPAHLALARMEDHFDEFCLVTQNIDGLHERSGSRNIVELHGNLWRFRDTVTGRVYANHLVPLPQIPPLSPEGNLLRPDVVWFGEMLPEGALEKAILASTNCDLFLVVGTSAVVQPSASLPLFARQQGAMVLEFNIGETEISSYVDHSFFGPAGETLPVFLELIKPM